MTRVGSMVVLCRLIVWRAVRGGLITDPVWYAVEMMQSIIQKEGKNV